jgi:hypothetical protein
VFGIAFYFKLSGRLLRVAQQYPPFLTKRPSKRRIESDYIIRKWRMRVCRINDRQHGFILLEVLIAIGLVSGVWMDSIQAYQGLALRLLKQEQKQALLQQEFDRYELAEQMRANSINGGGLKRDATRVPHRHGALHSTAKPAFAN